MATGRLGAVAPSATTYTRLYKPGTGVKGTGSISACNRSASAETKIRIAMSVATTPTNAEFIEYDTVLLPGESMQLSGIVLGDAHEIAVYADTANATFVMWGIEE